jgi:cytochrome c2
MSAYRVTAVLVLAAALAASAAFAADAKPNIENGKTVFAQQCGTCHAVNKAPGGPILGPNMVGLVGRKAGSVKDFAMYSAALKAYGVTWNAKTLDEFLINPMQKVPGTSMPMMLPDPKVRADVIGYLSTLKK